MRITECPHPVVQYFFVLGANDPEMQEIENILKSHRQEFVYATKDGRRVHAGNAYEADNLKISKEKKRESMIVFVECEPEGIKADVIIDHHRPGDYGYGRPPADYWEASSIGQAHNLLGLTPSKNSILAAAADHCLAHAYAGKCPNVEPSDLMEWRVNCRAAFQKRNALEIKEDIEEARVEIANLDAVLICDHVFKDARGKHIKELPEASARDGVMVMYSLVDRNSGKTKVGVLSGTKEGLEAWMNWARSQKDLENVYGDPARGYAGVYVKE